MVYPESAASTYYEYIELKKKRLLEESEEEKAVGGK